MSSITVYVDVSTVADEIRSGDDFGEFINELAETDYDYIGESSEELTDDAKELIKKWAKQIEEMEKNDD